jgi:hypothetical protein
MSIAPAAVQLALLAVAETEKALLALTRILFRKF